MELFLVEPRAATEPLAISDCAYYLDLMPDRPLSHVSQHPVAFSRSLLSLMTNHAMVSASMENATIGDTVHSGEWRQSTASLLATPRSQ